MILQRSKEYVENDVNANQLINDAKKVLKHRKELYARYIRKGTSFEKYITTICSSYFGGLNPTLTVKEETDEDKKSIIKKIFDKVIGQNANPEEFQLIIDYIRDYNDDSYFYLKLWKDYCMTGACYGTLYENEDNEIVYANLSSLQTVCTHSYEIPSQITSRIRIWDETNSNGEIIERAEIMTENSKRYFSNSVQKKDEFKEDIEQREDVKWVLIPTFCVENEDSMAVFEQAIPNIDYYEQSLGNDVNTFQYNDEAILKVKGYTPLNRPTIEEKGRTIPNPAYKEEVNLIRTMGIWFLGEDGDLDWATKNINNTANKDHKELLMQLILMMCFCPNITDDTFLRADSNKAMRKLFFPLEQSLTEADTLIKKEYLRMFENITDRINKKKNTKFDFRDIQIETRRNMPSEEDDIIDMWNKVRGDISQETYLSRLPLGIDAKTEMQRIKDENNENMEENYNNMLKYSDGENNEGNDRNNKNSINSNVNSFNDNDDKSNK